MVDRGANVTTPFKANSTQFRACPHVCNFIFLKAAKKLGASAVQTQYIELLHSLTKLNYLSLSIKNDM